MCCNGVLNSQVANEVWMNVICNTVIPYPPNWLRATITETSISNLLGFRKPIWWKLRFLVDIKCIHSCGNLHNSICLVFVRTWSAVSASVEYVLRCLYLELSILLSRNWCIALRNMSWISGGFCFWNLQMWRKEWVNVTCDIVFCSPELVAGYHYEIISTLLSRNWFLG